MTAYQLKALLCRTSSLTFVLTEHISSFLPVALTLSVHALEGYSKHFVCPFVLSVADLEDSRLLALQRDTNLNSMTI